MKRKIITIIALLAVMVAMTGAASAAEMSLLKDGIVLPEPIPVKNNDHFNIDLLVPALRPQDLVPPANIGDLAAHRLQCTNPAGLINEDCSIDDFNLTKLKDNFTVNSIPTTIQNDSVKIDVNAPLSRQPGTQYSFEIVAGPWGLPVAPAAASRTLVLTGGFITGKKCNDLNGDGICGQGEPGIEGWTIILRDENGTEINRTTTDANGNYAFKGNQFPVVTGDVVNMIFLGFRGTFTVEEVQQNGWTQTGPPAPGTYTVTIDANDATGLDFANNQTPSTTLTKEADKHSLSIGENVTYTYKETNDGKVNLTNASVEDSNCPPTYVSGDTNGNNRLDVGETWVFKCTRSYSAAGTYTNIAYGHGFTPQGIDVTHPDKGGRDLEEKATETVVVGMPGKFVGWGVIGSKQNPDMIVQIWARDTGPSGIYGSVDIKDNTDPAVHTVKSTELTSVITSLTPPKTGKVTGFAKVNDAGNYAFEIEIVDNANPSNGQDEFKISIPALGYNRQGTLTMGDISVIY